MEPYSQAAVNEFSPPNTLACMQTHTDGGNPQTALISLSLLINKHCQSPAPCLPRLPVSAAALRGAAQVEESPVIGLHPSLG